MVKLTADSTFKFNNKFLKQVDGCTTGGLLSASLLLLVILMWSNGKYDNTIKIFLTSKVSRRKIDNGLINCLNNFLMIETLKLLQH